MMHLLFTLLALSFAAPALAVPVRIMSFNTWHAGSQVNGGPAKIVDAITTAGADVWEWKCSSAPVWVLNSSVP